MNVKKCLEWAKDRGLLDNPDTSKQFQKLASECMEFLDEINKGNLEKAFLEFGDVLVTMIIYCEQRGLGFQSIFSDSQKPNKNNDGLVLIYYLGEGAVNEKSNIFFSQVSSTTLSRVLSLCQSLAPQFDPQRALDAAVEKISNRKTTLINGTAVKLEDL